MTVHFFEPPPVQKAGGLELAIRHLEGFLLRAGVTVRSNSPLEQLANRNDRELIHFHGVWQPVFLKVFAHCRRARIPYVVSPHGMLEPWAWRHKRWKKWPWFYLVERRHLAGATRLLTTSNAEAGNLRRFFPDAQCVALPLGLTSARRPDFTAARQALGWDKSEVVILFLSRIHPKKGLELLLRALTRVGNASACRVRMVIVGGGEDSYLCKLKRFVQAAGTRLPRVDWVGEIWDDRKWAYFQGADLFCLPSYSENFGLAVLESLQVGTRVLTTNQTPWGEIPSWGAGYVVEPSENAIRSALGEFLAHPEWPFEKRAHLATHVHAQFSWEAVGASYLQFYEGVLQGRSATV